MAGPLNIIVLPPPIDCTRALRKLGSRLNADEEVLKTSSSSQIMLPAEYRIGWSVCDMASIFLRAFASFSGSQTSSWSLRATKFMLSGTRSIRDKKFIADPDLGPDTMLTLCLAFTLSLNRFKISAVCSEDPSSETKRSQLPSVWAIKLSSCSARNFSPLWIAMRIRIFCVFSPKIFDLLEHAANCEVEYVLLESSRILHVLDPVFEFNPLLTSGRRLVPPSFRHSVLFDIINLKTLARTVFYDTGTRWSGGFDCALSRRRFRLGLSCGCVSSAHPIP